MVAPFEAVKVSTENLCLESVVRRHVYIMAISCIPLADSWKRERLLFNCLAICEGSGDRRSRLGNIIGFPCYRFRDYATIMFMTPYN